MPSYSHKIHIINQLDYLVIKVSFAPEMTHSLLIIWYSIKMTKNTILNNEFTFIPVKRYKTEGALVRF